MSEARPKPGSLKDRIKAFESQKQNKSDSSPPQPRPKLREWKPVQPTQETASGTTEEGEKAKERAGAGGGGIASDAKDSIQTGGFGSLKERMAALQGKGGFGGSPPPPPPAARPPPKKVISPPPVEGDEPTTSSVDEGEPASVTSPPDESSGAQSPPVHSPGEEKESQEPQEEDERARRAAIAARMARLGGTRFGMAPPVFGKKPPPPPVKKPSVEVQEESSKPETAEPVSKEPAAEQASPAEQGATAEGVTSPSQVPLPTSPPVASPPALLVGPKRAAPPRKKKPTPTSVPVAEKEVDPLAEAGAQAENTSVHPENVALPPSRSTTLDAGKEMAASPEPVPELEEKIEAKGKEGVVTPVATASPDPIDLPIHARLQSIATDSMADVEEAATPPPRSVTPSEENEEEYLRGVEEEVEDPMGNTQIRSEDGASGHSLQSDKGEEKRVPSLDDVPTPPSHETETGEALVSPPEAHETPAQIAERVETEDIMEGAQLTSESPHETSYEKGKEKGKEREEGMDAKEEEGPTLTSADSQNKEGQEEPNSLALPHDEDEDHKAHQLEEQDVTEGDEEDTPTKRDFQHQEEPARSPEADIPLSHEPELRGGEEEDEEAARKRRIADKMKKMGGFNPFGPASGMGSTGGSVGLSQSPARRQGSHDVPKKSAEAVSESSKVEEIAQEAEGEEDETARRKRIAEKMSKMGGFNPFGAPKPPVTAPTRDVGSSHESETVEQVPEQEEEPSQYETDIPPPPIPSRVQRRSIPPMSPPPDPILDSEGEELENDPVEAYGEEEDLPPPVPMRSGRGVPPPPPIDIEEEEEVPPPVPQRVARPIPSQPIQVPRMATAAEADDEEDETEENDGDSREGAATPIPRRSSFMDFTEDNEEEQEEEEVPPPPRRPPVPVPSRVNPVRQPSTSPPPVRPSRPSPGVPQAQPGGRGHGPKQSVMSISDLPHLRTSYDSENQHSDLYEPVSDEEDHHLEGKAADPIDPLLHDPTSPSNVRRASLIEQAESKRSSTSTDKALGIGGPPSKRSSGSAVPVPSPPASPPAESGESPEDEESSRRRTIAERMARLGGIKFGAAPPVPLTRRQQSSSGHSGETSREEEGVSSGSAAPLSAEAEGERRRAIASRLAGQGQLGRGVFGAPLPIIPRSSSQTEVSSPKAEQEQEPAGLEDAGLTIPAASTPVLEIPEDNPPPVPTRTSRGAPGYVQIPVSPPPLPPSRPSAPTPSRATHYPVSSPPQSPPPPPPPMKSRPSDFSLDPPSTPPPPSPPPHAPPTLSRSSTTKQAAEAAAGAQDTSMTLSLSEPFELSTIPSLAFDFTGSNGNTENGALQTSHPRPSVSEDSHISVESALQPRAESANLDALEALSNKLGPRIVQAAFQLHSNSSSKAKTSESESTQASLAFVNKVLSSVSEARSPLPYNVPPPPAPSTSSGEFPLTSHGYPIYTSSSTSQFNAIQPGDLIHFAGCHFQGRKGLQSYSINVGSGDGVWGVISETEKKHKHSKVKVFLAAGSSGQVENNGYRLEELKTGMVKVYRIPETSYVL